MFKSVFFRSTKSLLILKLFVFGLPLLINFSKSVAYSNVVPNCKELAKAIEIEKRLPENILTSISMVESGRLLDDGSMFAWPWSLNHAGKSVFFDTKDQALKYLRKNITSEFRNIDVGCMQVNVKWHYAQFSSFEEMIDPITNIEYAARFLLALKSKHGTWEQAIKHYHSSKEKFNKKYFNKVNRIWAASNRAENEDIKSVKKASLFLDDNIFYPQKPLLEKLIVNKVKNIKANEKAINLDLNSGYHNLIKPIKNNEEFEIVFTNEDSLTDNKKIRKLLKYKSAYFRDKVDMILLFREEFSK